MSVAAMPTLVREMHKEMGSMAVRAVDRYNASERYFTGMTIGVNEETYSRIIDEINICLNSLVGKSGEKGRIQKWLDTIPTTTERSQQ